MYRPRVKEIEEYLGEVPYPELDAGGYLIDLVFRLGPIIRESSLCDADLESWERRRGIELEPWEADAVITMSQAYMRESQDARSIGALSPWAPGQHAYRVAMDRKHLQAEDARRKAAERSKKESRPHGFSKRHRNPAPR